MILTKKITNRIIKFITNNTPIPEDKIEILDYGLKIIISNTIKLIILLLTAYFLNVLSYTLLALAFFGLVRAFASGTHTNSSLACIILNYILFLGNVFLSINLQLNTFGLYFMFIINLILLILYSPADTKKRPLPSKKLRKKLKVYSILVLIFSFIFSLFLNNSIYKTIISIANFEAAISTTPFMYKLFGNSYRNYDNITL
ncbi:accessory gene regulator B family protein [uncultured Clostridium sp.]|uniref:accessory gene regulator ArgB-like protein n=1 Tax=uncultured Clostridium sp. TaxID=59620 RepID=UPI0025CF160D|nr:accessory gene regulator B family protein [uncultured Clostridium sp.]